MKRYFRAGEDSLVGQVEHVVESRLERSRRAVDRFTTVCKAHPRVIAAFLGGSIAAGTADEQSDIDVYLLTRQNDYEEFFQDRERFLRSWSGIAWWKDHRDFESLGFDMMLFLMKDGVDGELALGPRGKLPQDSWWSSRCPCRQGWTAKRSQVPIVALRGRHEKRRC